MLSRFKSRRKRLWDLGRHISSRRQAVEDGSVKKADRILLNITGGGYKRLKAECKLYEIGARCEIKPSEGRLDDVEKELKEFVRAL